MSRGGRQVSQGGLPGRQSRSPSLATLDTVTSTATLPLSRSVTRMKTPVTQGGRGQVSGGPAQQRRSYGGLTPHTGQAVPR